MKLEATWAACMAVGVAAISLFVGTALGFNQGWQAHTERVAPVRDSLEVSQAANEILAAAWAEQRVIMALSAKYEIPADLAEDIYRAAKKAGLPADTAFRLIKVESNFNRHAVSNMAAYGLAQVRLPTAREVEPGVTREDLFDRRTNLRIGFTYFSQLLERFDGDWHLALTAYNRGPTRVNAYVTSGRDPSNGYARRVLGR